MSKTLVSCYLSGSKAGRMSAETAKRIEEAVKKLNYRLNCLARSLRTGKSRNIGFLVGNISDFYFGHLTEEVLEAARRLDYSPIIAVTRHSPKEKGEALDFLMRNRIDGLLTAVSIADVPQAFAGKRDSCPPFFLSGTGRCQPDLRLLRRSAGSLPLFQRTRTHKHVRLF